VNEAVLPEFTRRDFVVEGHHLMRTFGYSSHIFIASRVDLLSHPFCYTLKHLNRFIHAFFRWRITTTLQIMRPATIVAKVQSGGGAFV
jgi:hypothetical protein